MINSPRMPVLLAALALALVACAQATPYQPESASAAVSGGYSDERIGEDTYRVSFHGNSLTSRETVEAYLLYRAAELTLAEGGTWFTILDRETEHRVTREVRRDPFYRPWYAPTYGAWLPYWQYRVRCGGWFYWDPWHADPFWADRIDERLVEEFEASAEIRIGRGPTPREDRSLDARQVIEDIGPKVKRPAN